MASNMLTPNIKGILLARKYAYDILRRFFIEEPSKEYLRIFFGKKMHHQFPFKEEDKDIAEGMTRIENMTIIPTVCFDFSSLTMSFPAIMRASRITEIIRPPPVHTMF